jgi:hypothetical protein
MILNTPFLTDKDPREPIKGSRDPLGIQQVWIHLGRYVVGNLTTVSNSVRDFTVLLLGYHFIDKLVDELGPGSELSIFLKWEQLAAYARAHCNNDYSFRGSDRVGKTLSQSKKVYLSAEGRYQILSNQKVYGLWGLYTIPGRASGILEGTPLRLSSAARDLVQSLYLPILEQGGGKEGNAILEALRLPIANIDLEGKQKEMVNAVSRVLAKKLQNGEREWYKDRLLYGGPNNKTEGRQQQFAELISKTVNQSDFVWSLKNVDALAKEATKQGDSWHPLAYRLDRIRVNESVMAPASMLFNYLLGMHDQPIQSAAKRILDSWGRNLNHIDPAEFRNLRDDLAQVDPLAADRWCHIAETISIGHYEKLIRLLIEQNKAIMQRRGGAPWIEIRDGKLHVRFQEEKGKLLERNELEDLWRFSYFIDSLRVVAMTLSGGKRD